MDLYELGTIDMAALRKVNTSRLKEKVLYFNEYCNEV